jgi:hypothetical protein
MNIKIAQEWPKSLAEILVRINMKVSYKPVTIKRGISINLLKLTIASGINANSVYKCSDPCLEIVWF